MKQPIPSPYVIDFDKYTDSFDTFDDLPATMAWLQSVGAALGKKFGITLVPGSDNWEIEHRTSEFRVGSIEDIYTRRGVLGLLLNGVGRLAFSDHFPSKNKEADKFAKDSGIVSELAKHFSSLAKTVDEVRTDDKIAHEYSGGGRVVETMHAQAYDGAEKTLQAMAIEMHARKEMAHHALEWFDGMAALVAKVSTYNHTHAVTSPIEVNNAQMLVRAARERELETSIEVSFSNVFEKLQNHPMIAPKGSMIVARAWAVIMIAMYPTETDDIMKVLVRAYDRNLSLFGNLLQYAPTIRPDEEALIRVAAVIKKDVDEVKFFASHEGGHAQYVIAKAEQYYHGYTLGLDIPTSFGGYNFEEKALGIVEANAAARSVAKEMIDRGITTDLDDSKAFAKELLPLVEKFPYLDLNDPKQGGKGGGSTNMGRRVAGASDGQRQPKRDKEKEKRSNADRSRDRKQMEAMDNEKNQEEVDKKRDGYSIFDASNVDPLRKYLYIIGPYLSRITTLSARMRRILKVNDPAGLRGAYNRGKKLNTRILYKHRLNDFHLFARREIEKDQSYGFVLMGDLSGSTESKYSNANNRLIQDEILASAFLLTEVADRIGEKVMCSIGFFTDSAQTIKRAGFYLVRSKIVSDVKNHGGGTNVNAAGNVIEEDLQEMTDFRMKRKTIVFITDGAFNPHEFMSTVKAAKKFKASIAYFQIGSDNSMCKEIEHFVSMNAKGVRVRTRAVPTNAIHTLPEAMMQLMKETISSTER